MNAMNDELIAYFDDRGSIMGVSSITGIAQADWKTFGGAATKPAYERLLSRHQINQLVASGDRITIPGPAPRYG
jgi:hypothetical protein